MADNITRLGYLRKMRLVARAALETFGIHGRFELLRWIKGRSVLKIMMPRHYHAQGRLIARLHDFSAAWSPPPSPVKRHFDWDGLFVNDMGSGMPNAED
jgi:Ser/Thr protein kinase RdoA (MazF antagonist)